MSQTNELLNSLTDDEMALYSADPSTEPYIIINDDRTITVPDELKRIAVQNDHNIETVTFICPASWDAINFGGDIVIYINYVCSDGSKGSYHVPMSDVSMYEWNDIMFTWVISNNVTKVPGNLRFNVCIKKIDSEGFDLFHWNTEICEDTYVSPGLDCVNPIVEAYPDIFAQIVEKVNGFDSSTVVFKTVEGAEIDNVTNDDRVLFFKQSATNYAHAPFDSAVIFSQVPDGRDVAHLGGAPVMQTALADDGTVWIRSLAFNSEDPPGYRAATVDWVEKSSGGGNSEAIGDIETALDSILAIQNELIGGES